MTANSKNIIGDSGEYFAAYALSFLGFLVRRTAKNAKGADLLILNQEGNTHKSIQVKTLRQKKDVKVGYTQKNTDPCPELLGDYWVFVDLTELSIDKIPQCYIWKSSDLNPGPDNNPGKKHGKYSWWLSQKDFLKDSAKSAWNIIIEDCHEVRIQN